MDAPTIFCWPDRPTHHHVLKVIAVEAGWRFVDRPEGAWLRVLHRDATCIEPGAADPWETESIQWINGRCRDVSKSRVAHHFAQAFGRPLAVDPLTWVGPMVVKPDDNYRDDGRVIQGPLTVTEPGMVYQRYIDTGDGGPLRVEHRVLVVGNSLPAAIQHTHRTDRGQLVDIQRQYARVLDPADLFSAEEREQMLAFCRAYGLDYGGLDVLRDRHDGLVYIVDANSTQGAAASRDATTPASVGWRGRHSSRGGSPRRCSPGRRPAIATSRCTSKTGTSSATATRTAA